MRTESVEGLFFRFDGHLTPAGNRVVAEVFLEELLPLVTGVAESTSHRLPLH